MKKLVIAALALMLAVPAFATSDWYEYCHAGYDALNEMQERHPEELFTENCYPHYRKSCKISQEVNFFNTKTTFTFKMHARRHYSDSYPSQTYKVRVVYKKNKSGGRGVCRLASFEVLSVESH